ncbi:MAG: alpha/beta hydrolase family protein [Gordonia sp. (in: high G+C Gram-positive bacteria)]|uniref:alpha/beta hydrolase n=1 Tax=Gordonia sp. (in: high G+C Gram-positive bacteria) TaxID=84139 RepID=UPI0039E44D29
MNPPARLRLASLLLAGLLAVIGLVVVPGGDAEARVVGVRAISPRVTMVSVYSAAMRRVVHNHVLHPAGRPAGLPSFYMLPGAGGAEDGISWYHHGGVRSFFAGKRVNVVLPIGGKFSMMANWRNDDPLLGRNQWQTFYTRELPTSIDRFFRTSGANAISGVSMSAGPALDLAIQAPSRFRAVAAYSGCPGTTDPLGRTASTVVPLRGGGNPFNMWGVYNDPEWIRNDPVVNAPRLRGKTIFLSAASGVPGAIDGGPLTALGGMFGGNVVEAVALNCTINMSNRLTALDIPHRFNHRPQGSHSWGLFSADMRASWPMIARALRTR